MSMLPDSSQHPSAYNRPTSATLSELQLLHGVHGATINRAVALSHKPIGRDGSHNVLMPHSYYPASTQVPPATPEPQKLAVRYCYKIPDVKLWMCLAKVK